MDQHPASVIAGRHAHEPVNEIVNDLGRVLEPGIAHHLSKVDSRGVAWNRLDLLDRHLPPAERAVARVEVFIAVGQLVGFRDDGALAGAGRRRRRCDVQTLPNPIGHAPNLLAPVDAIRRDEVDVREENVAREIAALQQQSRCNPAPALRPSCHGRGPEQQLSQRAGG